MAPRESEEFPSQSQTDEIQEARSQIEALRKRVRELESAAKQPAGSAGSDADLFHARHHLDTQSAPISVEGEKKSLRIFSARRWRTAGRKRRW
jgi:hypothetical protein